MDLHDNARTKPFSRALIVDSVTRQRQPVRAIAAHFGVSPDHRAQVVRPRQILAKVNRLHPPMH